MSTVMQQQQRKADGVQRLAAIVRDLGPAFAEREPKHDAEDTFVAENYTELRERKAFSAAVPAELGGGGATHADVCEFIRAIARHSPSTALAFSMHSHLLQTVIWRHRKVTTPPLMEPLLRRIASEELVLVSSGASDWLDGSGVLAKDDGAWRLSGRKIFGSGAPAGDLLLTTGVYDDPQQGKQVFHFGVNLHDPTVKVLDNWRTMGMRATGSNDIVIEGFKVPDPSISLRRPAGKWHPFYDVVAVLAFPLVMAAYVGLAESARDLALRAAEKRKDDPVYQSLVGEMDTELLGAQSALEDAIITANDPGLAPSLATSRVLFQRKTLIQRGAIRTVELAFEIVGGRGFFRSAGIERLFRDVQGARYHPLQEAKQYLFGGRIALGLDPVGPPSGKD
ncbi:MAG: acyl-CoA dehydrogenase family protein [Candidatus Limnocylindria bacterium]